MYLCAVTQLAQRKLAQSVQRATAFSSALQLVQTIRDALISDMSIAFMVTTSRGSADTPPLTRVSWLHDGHTTTTTTTGSCSITASFPTPVSAAHLHK